jgi:hypothetical protein
MALSKSSLSLRVQCAEALHMFLLTEIDISAFECVLSVGHIKRLVGIYIEDTHFHHRHDNIERTTFSDRARQLRDLIVDAVERTYPGYTSPRERGFDQVPQMKGVHKMMRVRMWIRKDNSVNVAAVEASLRRPISPMCGETKDVSHPRHLTPSWLHTTTMCVSICRETFPLAWILVY